METNELAMDPCCAQSAGEKRAVEAELKLPKVSEIKLPVIDLRPARKVAADVLLTGLGIGVLAVRGAWAAGKAAYQAGASAAEKPGTVAHTVVSAVRGTATASSAGGAGIKRRVPVLPLADYDTLSESDVLTRLNDLSAEQLTVLREYELTHANRGAVVDAIQARLA